MAKIESQDGIINGMKCLLSKEFEIEKIIDVTGKRILLKGIFEK